MSRYIRNTTVLCKIESTYGTDSIPTGAANAILVSDVNITPTSNNVSRDLIRSYFGASEELVGTKYISLSMTVELQSSGTAGDAPAWGPLLRSCAFAESILATPDRVEYMPVTTGLESSTIYYYVDGILYKATGCRGNVSFNMNIGERPTMTFAMMGIDGGVSATTPSGVDFSSFKTPVVVTDNNCGDFLLGCTYSAGALSGGTAYSSRGLAVDMGNDVQFNPTLNGESIDIVNRSASGQMSLDVTAAQEVTIKGEIDANTTTSIGFTIGSTSGYIITPFFPAVQRTNPAHEDNNGVVYLATDLRMLPDSGNDEVRIVCL